MLKRRYDPEIMDDLSIQDQRMDRALDELRLVNRFLGGQTTTRRGMRLVRKNLTPERPLSILDLGAGGADVFDGTVVPSAITALDRNMRVCEYVKRSGPPSVICGDARHLSFRDGSFDVVHASLFFHHFHEEDIHRILSACTRIARHGIILNDLRRSRLACAGIRILTAILSRSPMVRHDAPLSVLRGFSRRELEQLLARCGITTYSLHRTWAFRWLVVVWV